MRKTAVILLSAVLLSAFSGCEAILTRSVTYITPVELSEAGIYDKGISNREGLEKSIREMIGGREASLSLLIGEAYKGDVVADAKELCETLPQDDVDTAYYVSSINVNTTVVGSEYLLVFYISYNEGVSGNLMHLSSDSDLMENIRYMISITELRLSASGSFTYSSPEDINVSALRWYFTRPENAVGFHSVDTAMHPFINDDGQRVLDLYFNYSLDPAGIAEKKGKMQSAASEYYKKISGVTNREKAESIYENLCADVEPMEYRQPAIVYSYALSAEDGGAAVPDTELVEANSEYGAFVNYRASSMGIALAFSDLCDKSGLYSTVVAGKFGAQDHFWNMVLINSNWYHVDCMPMLDTISVYLLTDDELTKQGYFWDRQYYYETPKKEGEHS